MELFTYTFVQYAFFGGTAMAILAGVLGPFVVQSKQSVASDMFAHVALAGIGGALVLGFAPWWGALPALLIVSSLMWWLQDSHSYSPDSLAMFFLSGGLALALAFVHVAKNTTFSFENYLFGSILTLTKTDIVAIYISAVIVIALVWYFWYQLIGATREPIHITPHNNTSKIVLLVYFWVLALVVWIGIKTIGGLLIGALLVIPVLTVCNWTSSFKTLVFGSVIVSLLSMILGLLVALFIDIPPSSLIVGMAILLFIFQTLVKKFVFTS